MTTVQTTTDISIGNIGLSGADLDKALEVVSAGNIAQSKMSLEAIRDIVLAPSDRWQTLSTGSSTGAVTPVAGTAAITGGDQNMRFLLAIALLAGAGFFLYRGLRA